MAILGRRAAVGSGGGERGGMRRCEQYYARGDVGEKRGE